MARILSHPFRIMPNGSAATVEQDSDAGQTEQVAVLIMTNRGERSLAVDYGIPDPVFSRHGIEPTELAAALARWGPPVTLDRVSVEPHGDRVLAVRVTFKR